MTDMESKTAAAASFVTPVLKDNHGRGLTRTMRRTDKLLDLMRFYYDMVPRESETIPFSNGGFSCTAVGGSNLRRRQRTAR
jgi:hypothetical protein